MAWATMFLNRMRSKFRPLNNLTFGVIEITANDDDAFDLHVRPSTSIESLEQLRATVDKAIAWRKSLDDRAVSKDVEQAEQEAAT